jgi:hypothetical protein
VGRASTVLVQHCARPTWLKVGRFDLRVCQRCSEPHQTLRKLQDVALCGCSGCFRSSLACEKFARWRDMFRTQKAAKDPRISPFGGRGVLSTSLNLQDFLFAL